MFMIGNLCGGDPVIVISSCHTPCLKVWSGGPYANQRHQAVHKELFLLVIQDQHAQSLMDDLVSWTQPEILLALMIAMVDPTES